MKISIAIIMMPSITTEICHFFQEKRQSKRRWILIKVHGIGFQKRTVIIGNESLQLGVLLTAVDSKRNCVQCRGPQKSRSHLKILDARRVTLSKCYAEGSTNISFHVTENLMAPTPRYPVFENPCRSCFFTSTSGRHSTCQLVVTPELYTVYCAYRIVPSLFPTNLLIRNTLQYQLSLRTLTNINEGHSCQNDVQTLQLNWMWSKSISPIFILLLDWTSGHVVVQLAEALRCKPEGNGFDSRWCHWNFALT
jgi:hypothetical protein